MTSVTVAGGSFDIIGRPAKPRVSRSKRDRWLRYGIGVSIAGLLAADALVLSGMLDEAVPGTRRAERAAPQPDVVMEGAGFAAFDVPTDFSALIAGATTFKAAPRVAAPAAAPPVAEAAAPPAEVAPTAPVPAAPPSPPAAPAAPAPQIVPPAASTPAPVPSVSTVVEEVVTVVEQVPVVGPEAAPVVETVAEPVVDAVAAVAPTVAKAVAPVVAPVLAPVAADVVEPAETVMPVETGLL